MKYFDLSSKNRSSCHWINFAAASLLAVALAGCGGGGGTDTTVATPATPAAPAAGAPAGTAVITAAAGSPATTNTADNPAQAFGLIVTAGAAPITVQSPPVVNFAVIDSTGKHVPGLTLFNASGATADPNCSGNNVTFAIAKLTQPTDNSPSTWQNLISRQRLAADTATQFSVVEGTTDPKPTATLTNPATAVTDPSTRVVGILEENAAGGYYTYRFAIDVSTPLLMADAVAGKNFASTATAVNKIANNGNVAVKDGKTIHRLGAQLCYTDPATKAKVVVNPYMDFTLGANGAAVPVMAADGKTLAAVKKVVDKDSCNECHSKLATHGGARVDPNYCVICHNPGSKDYHTNNVVDLKLMIHRFHMGVGLANDYTVADFDAKKTDATTGEVSGTHFPQDVRNCTKCHDGSDSASHKTAQGDNWKNVPSRNACGACHDGINFATGKGVTHADAQKGLTTSTYGHVGGSQSDDSACALCHKAADINVYHIPVTPPNTASALHVAGGSANTNAASLASNTSRLPAGAIKVTYDISSVSVNASKNPVMVFRLLQNGTPQPFSDPNTSTEIWPGFMGAPSVYFVFAVPQDGITAPADFNASVSSYLRSLWNGKATGTAAGTLTGPDASGYYTATLTGVTIPTSAVMLTGGLGFSYNVLSTMPLTQTNLADYPVTAATAATGLTAGMPNKTGGLIVIAPTVQKVATGYTGRRAIVEDARCNKCHQELGAFTHEAFHGGQRNDGTTCSWCHNPNRTSSGWSADSTSYIHAIHAAGKRETKFNWHAVSATDGFWKIHFPGVLKACETCHLPGTYDFSAAASASALPNRLYRTVATGTTAAATISTSPYVAQTAGTAYGAGFSFSVATGVTTGAAGTTLVNSPIATACFACHDSTVVRQHMESNGASIYKDRTSALAKAEQCMFCHSSTSAFGLGIKAVHATK